MGPQSSQIQKAKVDVYREEQVQSECVLNKPEKESLIDHNIETIQNLSEVSPNELHASAMLKENMFQKNIVESTDQHLPEFQQEDTKQLTETNDKEKAVKNTAYINEAKSVTHLADLTSSVKALSNDCDDSHFSQPFFDEPKGNNLDSVILPSPNTNSKVCLKYFCMY